TTSPFSEERTRFALLLLRILPLVPYVALNYLAGLARIRPRDYILTTFFGSIPSVFAFAYFIDTMRAGVTGAATQARVLAVCAGAAVIVIIARWLALRVGSPGR
ncbi:MAG TPA: VTT domain-containing protein, partial [Thermoanaerobaculia bacterium]|nr:VTT domain-containing protein [Thermoanaerobaculia bacterium]